MQTPEEKKAWRREHYLKNRERMREETKRYRKLHPEQVKAAKKRWQQSKRYKEYQIEYWNRPEVRERYRLNQWKRKYGVPHAEAKEMLARQNNRCAICGEILNKPYLDHCHQTNKLRGFLCTQCNVGLGSFRDNTTFLLNAIKYLEKNGDFEVQNRRILPNGKVV